jgi:C_GCAxxG_C_C family probable redox protein
MSHASRGPRAPNRISLPRRRMLALAIPACGLLGREAKAQEAASPGASAPPVPQPPNGALSVDDRIYLALEYFRQGFHCSQSVLAAYADQERLREDSALRLAAALAGGSTVGGECGAVASSYLVLGLKYGRTVPAFGDVERERELFDRIRYLVAEFERRHGAITCRELLGVDVFTREGLAEGRRRDLFARRCPQFIRDAIALVESSPAGTLADTSPPRAGVSDPRRRFR